MPKSADRLEPILHNRLAVLRAERGLSRQDLATRSVPTTRRSATSSVASTTRASLLAFAIADHFGLPIEAVFSPRPFPALSDIVYHVTPA